MDIFHLDVWINDGPSVTGRHTAQGAVYNASTGDTAVITSGDELRAFLQDTAGDDLAIVVAEFTDPE
jgi:hypothetical protein